MIGDIDVTAGLGWGRLADNETFVNPFAQIFKSFDTRSIAPATGGTPAFGQLFHGHNMGAFGAIDWRTPVDGLNLLAEYSSDKYVSEQSFGVLKPRAPFNFGVSYAPLDDLRLMVGWFYGTTIGGNLVYERDPTVSSSVPKIGPPVPPPYVRSDKSQLHAMTLLLDKDRPYASGATKSSLLSRKNSEQASLEQAFLTETRGVSFVELDGKTLLVAAHNVENAALQCRNYAQLAEASGAAVGQIALTDPDDPTGKVSICNVAAPRGPMLINASLESAAADDAGRKIRADAAEQRLPADALDISQSEIWLYFRNQHYLWETEAAGRLARVLMRDAPPSVEIFHLILVQNGIALREFRIDRNALERASEVNGTATELANAVAVRLPDLDQPVLNAELAKSEPRISWAIGPGLRESFFDPQLPFQLQIFAEANGDVELAKGLDLTGEVDVNVFNNFNLAQTNNSVLPHVRSDIVQYLKHGINGIGDLEVDYRMRLAPDVYSKIKVGYLEDMFAGAGGEVLWRPEGQRISIGADLYEVWQRSFDRLFNVQNYHVLTGHISLYYNSPFYGLNLNLHAGRYLAGDYGATVELTRKFDTGVEVGAFATFTNVPFAKFGEGSFDKGFIIRIPFEWSLPFYTQTVHTTVLHSLSRDGGQRLSNDDSLYEETRNASYGEISDHLDLLTGP